MRKSRNGQRRAFAAFTKFSVLLMCFATVFALVLTAGVFDIGGSDMNANVAEAANSGSLVTEGTGAYDTSQASVQKAQLIMHGQSNSWNNVQTRLTSGLSTSYSYGAAWGRNDDNSYSTSPWQGTSGSNSTSFGVQTERTWGNFYTYAAVQIEIPDAILLMLQNGWKVTATFSGQVYRPSDSSDACAAAIISGSTQGVSFSRTAYEGWGQGDSSNYLYSFSNKTITLNSSDLYLTLYVYGYIYGSNPFSSYINYVGCINPTVTYNLTRSSTSMLADGNAPQVASQPSPTGTNTSHLGAGNRGEYFYANAALAGNINSVTQTSIWDGNTTKPTINLDGVAVPQSSLNVTEVGGVSGSYAKKVQLNINEINKDGGTASGTQANYYAGLAGITVGSITSQTSTIYNGSFTHGAFTYSVTGGTGDGYYHWKVSGAARDKGVLTLYFNDNVSNLKVRVYDSGNSYLEITVNVDGIKSGGDNMNSRGVSVTAGEYMTDKNDGKWLWNPETVLSPSFTNAGAGAYAQVWFYAVKRYDSLDAANGTAGIGVDTADTTGWQPIGYSTNDSGFRTVSGGLEFDISTGMLSSIPAVNGDGGNGSGYYRFEFYNMNYAGYVSSSPVVRVVKVDIDTPDPTTTLTYDETKNPLVAGTLNDGEIYTDQMAYVSTDLTVTVTLNKVNFSGNKVSVLGADGKEYIFLVGYDGGITGIYTVSEDGSLTPASGWSDNTQKGDVFATVKVTSEKTGTGGLKFTAVYTGVDKTITTKQHNFVVYNNADELDSALTGCLNGRDTAWNGVGGTRLYFDHVGIDDVTFGDEYASKTTGVIPAGDARNWFTDKWEYGGDLTISTTDEYQYIFYKLAYYTQDFGTAEGTSGEYAAVKGEFDSNAYFAMMGEEVMAAGGWTLLDSGVRIDFTNIAETQAGYYVVYVITADRASHFDFTAFGVLVDATDYKIRAEYDAETLKVLGNIDPFGLAAMEATTYKRGDLYTFTPELKDEYKVAGAHMYVPYQVKKAVWDAEKGQYNYAYIYSHAANDTTGVFKENYLRANYLYASIAEGDDGTTGIGLALDVDRNSVTQLPAANGQTAIVFSFRQVVNVSFDNAVEYTGKYIPITVNAYDLNGGQVTITEGNEPYVLKYQGTGTYEGVVTNAGSYGFLLDYKSKNFYITDENEDSYLEHSQYYVLAATPTVTLNVRKVELFLDVALDPGTLYYGDVTGDNAVEKLGLSYEITGGLVGQDVGKTFDKLTGQSVVTTVVGASSGVYLDAGSHNVTVAFSTTNYNVSVNWTPEEQVLQIAKRELAFTVDSPANVTYGNAMPSSYTVRMDKSEFDFDTLGKYTDADDVGNMLGVPVTEEGGQWVFNFNADAFAAFTPVVNDKGYYNVGDYAITGFNVEKTSVNNNFAPTQTGESKVTVVTRVVTVSPTIPEETINVEDLSELDGRKFSINATGNPDVTAFGIRGDFVVGDRVSGEGTEYTYSIKGDVSTFTSDHNTDDVTNVEIKFGGESWTFTVHIITAAGQFVIEFKSADIFTVTYGELFDAAAIAENAGDRYYTVLYYPKEGEGYATESTAIPDGVTLNVTITAAGYQADLYANHAGNYNLTVSAEARGAAEGVFYTYAYRIAGDAPLPTYVTVETLQATVKVSEVTALSKQYGADNPAINPEAFGFAFTSEAHQDLLDAFIAANGTISVSGIGTTWNRTASVGLYDYNWSNCTFYTTSAGDIAPGDIRFEIVGIEGVKFEITPKELDFNALVGSGGILVTAADKGYDGETAAEGASLSFASGDTIVVAGEVALGYDANYWDGTGYVAEVGSGYAVRFANIVLTGAGVNNYTLVIADGEEEGEYGFYFDYKGTDGAGFGISPEAVTFLTNFFSVSKTFDGGTGMEQGNIAFNPGTGFEAFGNGWSLVEGKFDSANAGKGILVTFKILCPEVVYPNVTEEYPIEAYYIMPEGLALTPVNGAGEKGVYIEVTGNVTGEIGQFTLSFEHINFKFESADRTKVYDGNGVFDVLFEFNDTIKGLLVEGFDFGSIGLEFAGETEKKVGNHAMKITGVSIDDDTNFRLGSTLNGNDVGEGGTATGKDYATIEGMINGTTGGKPFSITPKTLTFDVAFEGVNVYAGLETLSSATTPATIYGVIAGEDLNITASTYTYARAAAEGGYETFVYVQAERFDEASGNYYHDVLITITVSTGNGFDWNNYTLKGLNKVDGKDNEFTVFREGAAILNPRDVEINLSEVKVFAKTYDATNAVPAGNISFADAFATGAPAGTDATNAFIGTDFDNLVFSYTATYDSANAGTNRKVSISGLTLTAKEGFDHVALSYNITSQVSTTVNGIIKPVEVEVSFRLPDKVYDGTGFGGIGVNGIYPLGARESAADLEVRLSATDGRANWYVDGETAFTNYQMRVRAVYYSSTDASETAQGFVLGYELIVTSGGNASPAVNYVIKGASSDTVEYAVFALTADELTAEAAKLITAQYTSGGETFYLVKASAIPAEGIAGLKEEDRVALNSFEATGVINPAEVSFSVTIVNPGAFVKDFDDTAGFKIAPEYGTDYTVEVPGGFFDSSGLSGKNFTVTFDSAAVGVRDVIFTVSGTSLGGNFVFNDKDNSFVAEGEGRIDKISLTVSLYTAEGGQNEPIRAVYGGEAFGYKLNYTLSGQPLTVADGYAYVTVAEWQTLFGHNVVPDEVNGRRYNLTEGEYVLDAEGTYVRLTGKIGAAALTTADGKAFVNDKGRVSIAAGTYNDVKVTVAADSFNVNKATQGNVTQVIVSPAEIKVTVTPSGGNGFTTQYYIGKLPGATFAWFDKDATGVTVDDAAAVLKSIRASFVDAEGKVITDTDLDITGVYTLDADVTGSYKGNYKVVVVGADGNETTHTLTVTVPALDESWFSLKTVLKKTYSLDAESNPVALTENDVLGGISQGDVVTITWYKDSVALDRAPSAAGEYEFVITVKRPVGGTHGYFYGHGGTDTYSRSGVFEITKRDVNIAFIEKPSFVYDGQEHQIDPALALKATDKQNNQVIEGFINVLGVMYNLNGESLESMVNAGTYVLEITVGAEYAANYNVTESTLKITVAAAPVTVSVTEASKTQDVTGGATEPVTIDFSVQGFATSDFKVVYRDSRGRVVDSVTTPGVYTYTILPLNSNYTVRDGGTGSLTVTISEVSFVKDDVSYVTVKFPAPVTVGYTVTDTAVASGSNYWKTVDGNVQALAGEDEILTTDGILRIEVKGANGIVTNIPGGVEITARIPDTVGSSYSVYRVTEDGKLALMEAGTDYTVSGNTITYTTEYISNLVFVGTGTPGFDWWILLLAAAALVLVFALAVLIAVLVKLHRAPDSVPVEVAPIDSIMPAPAPAPAPAAPAPVIIPAADIAPVTYDAPAAVSKHKQPPIIGIR